MKNRYYPEKGEGFVCVNEDYSSVDIYRVSEKNQKLYASKYNLSTVDEKGHFEKVLLSDLKGPFFPTIMGYVLSGKGMSESIKPYVGLYSSVRESLDSLLFKLNNDRVLISVAVDTISESIGVKKSEVESVLKVLLAEKFSYKFKSLQSGDYIEFSSYKKQSENSKKYFGSLADEIAIKSKQIDLLVSHGQTVGNYREYILRSLLEKYLPSKFSVVTGFIEGISRQIDILIIDSHNYSPIFKEGDLVVARRESVRAIIEVKTNLDAQKLDESLDILYDSTRGGIFKPQLPIFKGIYSFDSTYTSTKAMVDRVYDFYNKPYYEPQVHSEITRGIDYLYREVTCVCTLGKHFIYTNYEFYEGNPENNILPSMKSVKDEHGLDIQTAMFIASLFRHLDVDYYSKNSTLKNFSSLLQTHTVKVKHEKYLVEKDWTPSLRSMNEHDGSQKSIINRLALLKSWFNGEISNHEYICTLKTDENAV
ncbi:hypothetical protein HJ171_23010 [Vibrio parahaemolyticus]|uniref:DUF6602 domain-containing protein n=3 Tax=Vibrio parahaemolyticus TaxID=670 RepID=UPI0006A583DD|nr:DUF6602 domain-containing protein [Vibrio parahaemolyticus]EHR7861333.1 hypothetical protein [Vibrio parahaemolyticus]EJC6932466.1 hypothetical protein [Vibrio parahaemolyticus]MBE3840067.1 hypothetical protein [Vibrio parahaemolyticus]MDG2632738.1 hypothetical protein [Vibrio parahaemolyticus]TOF28427.1 hypothetical protein CGJ25_23305 [Vibrio parahaemolyticus]